MLCLPSLLLPYHYYSHTTPPEDRSWTKLSALISRYWRILLTVGQRYWSEWHWACVGWRSMDSFLHFIHVVNSLTYLCLIRYWSLTINKLVQWLAMAHLIYHFSPKYQSLDRLQSRLSSPNFLCFLSIAGLSAHWRLDVSKVSNFYLEVTIMILHASCCEQDPHSWNRRHF